MSDQRRHLVEKITVEIAVALGMLVMACLVWPLLRPPGPNGTVAFIAEAQYGRLALFALAVWALAVVCSLITLTGRPQGALLATLAGAVGISLRTEPARLLLMTYTNDPRALMIPLAIELALLTIVVLVAVEIIYLVRYGVARVKPTWVRAELELPAPTPAGGKKRSAPEPAPAPKLRRLGPIASAIVRSGPLRGTKSPRNRTERMVSALSACAVTWLIGLIMQFITLFSADRWQILFALAVSFFVAALVAEMLFPNTYSAPYWMAPILMGIVFYLKACLVPGGDLAWELVGTTANALPIDWFSAGCGGAVLGYWLARRIEESRRFAVATEVQPVA